MRDGLLEILVADDSLAFRKTIRDVLASVPGVKVVAIAANGRLALQQIESLRPDVVMLDLEMPEMSGLEVIAELQRRGSATQAIVVCGRSSAQIPAERLQELNLNVADFILKPESPNAQHNFNWLREKVIERFLSIRSGTTVPSNNVAAVMRSTPDVPDVDESRFDPSEAPEFLPELLEIVPELKVVVADKKRRVAAIDPRAFEVSQAAPMPVETRLLPTVELPCNEFLNLAPATTPSETRKRGERLDLEWREPASTARSAERPRTGHKRIQLVAIGISTGGPQTLSEFLPRLPFDFPAPIVIVQHMPPKFTKSLADSLTRICRLPVKEANDGDLIVPGRVLIAPGGKQLRVEKDGANVVARITDDPPELSCKPSVNYLFRSVADVYDGHVLGVILTGMGNDGTEGCRYLRERGGTIFAQDEATSVVFGMPQAVIAEGLADGVCSLGELPTRLVGQVSRGLYACK